MKPRSKADQDYARKCAVARSWAATAPLEELRRGNAERIARSYGLQVPDAHHIIVNVYRERMANG